MLTRFSQRLLSLDPPHHLVIALSGGLDSMVLLHLASSFVTRYPDFKVRALHVHHGLSPHADSWLAWCESSCQKLGIPFLAERVHLEYGARQSLEAVARLARYRVFADHLAPEEALLTAHHQDDQLETVLLALKRGAGLKGLSGIGECQPFARGYLLRPLLGFSRGDLELWAHTQQLDWVEDESNLSLQFDRNFLRHRIIPELKQRWPGVAKSALRSAKICAQQQSLLDELAAEDLGPLPMDNPDRLSLTKIRDLSEARRANLLRLWLAQRGAPTPSFDELAQLQQQMLDGREDAAPIFPLGQWLLRRYRDHLYFDQPRDSLQDWHQEVQQEQWVALPQDLGRFRLYPSEMGCRLRSPLSTQKMTLRFAQQGLRCHPLGRCNGSRSVKKLFQEAGIPPWLRGCYPQLFYDHQLVAILGLWVEREFVIEQGAGLGWQLELNLVCQAPFT